MAESEVMLASAVVLPEASEPEPDSANSPNAATTLKRRQSSATEDADASSKRPRLSGSPRLESPTEAPAAPQEPARRASTKVEERKRGQRMFGALLGALSQKGGSSAAAKRRAELERKQQDRLKEVKENASAREKEMAEGLRKRRRREQWKWDEQSMRIKHSNMLATANFLSTTEEPKLFFRPWQLRQDQESQLARQIEDANAQIDRETADFERRRNDALVEEDRLDQEATANEDNRDKPVEASEKQGGDEEKDSPVGSQPSKPADESSLPVDTTPATNTEPTAEREHENEPAEASSKTRSEVAGQTETMLDADKHALEDEEEQNQNNGDMVVAEEDTVMY